MSEISGETSLAIVEKRPQRPGGCVGIFFQLFDWNRRFAKKKIFSKKLLPPIRLRKPSKKFGGDEKQPKLRLIADENSGGFPHVKKNEGCCNGDTEPKNEMRTPGLVARLMGLEYMPALQQDKSKKALLSGNGSDKGEKFVHSHGRFEREELISEKGEIKQELRPQKLQKTRQSERKVVTRFGAEALQLKNVLARSRKNHQKLVSPVKSPRNVSGRNASRLIGAATRILEPGLQRSRSTCALTYSDVVHHPPTAGAFLEEANHLKPFQNASGFQISATPLKGQSSSCKNCGHSLDISDVRPNTEEQQPVFSPMSQFMNSPSQMSKRDSQTLPIFCPELEKGKHQNDSQLYAAFAVENRQPCAGYTPDIKLLKKADQTQLQATSLQCKLQKDVSPACLRYKTPGQNQTFQVRDRLPSKSKLNKLQSNIVSAVANANNDRKDFVLLKQNLSDHSHLRMPPKENIYRLDADPRIGERRHDSFSPVRKRRLVSSRQHDGSSFVGYSFAKPTNTRSSAISGNDWCSTSHLTIGPCTNIRLAHLQGSKNADSGKNDSDVISFSCKSPVKRKTAIHADVEGRMIQKGPNRKVALETSVLNENEEKRNSLKSFPLTRDSLGALLEQKLQELTCQEEDSAIGDATPMKTTAVILQELISALKTERSCHQDELAYGVNNRESYLCSDNQQYKENTTTFQPKPKSTKISVGYLSNGEHLSPGSVLDVSFSNDSCASSSLDDGSRCHLDFESTECCEGQQQLKPDADLLDSACSLSMGKFYRESVNNLLNNISEVFSNIINLVDVHLKGSKFTHAEEVILNAELVFWSAAQPDAAVDGGFSISHFVLYELEMLASIMWTYFSFVAFCTQDGNQLKGFVFDCIIEFLESRFSRYSNSGFSAWTRLPIHMKTEMLICEIVEEVGSWAELAGLFLDELIEHEMSHSLGKWIDFEIEAFETGIEIDGQILQTLITEAVVDFTGYKSVCC